MKRNLLLFLALFLGLVLIVNGVKRVSYLRTNAQKVGEEEKRLEVLKQENENLKRELEYKGSNEFVEGEIRNKLGLAKKGEAVVILPKDESLQSVDASLRPVATPNYIKWWDLFFGG